MDGEYRAALERATKLLSIRARSRRELRDRLAAAGYSAGVVEEVDAYLAELGLVNDEEFALGRVRHLLESGRSSGVIKHDLALRGIAEEVAEAALGLTGGPGADASRALELARQRARSCGSLPGEKAFARVARYLCSRGYDPEVAEEACTRVFGPRWND